MTDEKTNPEKQKPEKVGGETDFEILHYSLDNEGHWNSKMLSNWGAKDIINTQTWTIVEERMQEAKDKVLRGEMSPIGFYMVKCIMDVKLCAEFTGYPKWRVKKHMKPEVFKKLPAEKLKRYADVFEISVEDLMNLEEKLKNEPKNDA